MWSPEEHGVFGGVDQNGTAGVQGEVGGMPVGDSVVTEEDTEMTKILCPAKQFVLYL